MEIVTTTELAKKFNKTNAAINHILKGNDLKPVSVGDHNCLIWDKSVEDIIEDVLESETRHVNAKQYAEELKVPYDTFREILKQFGITDTHKMFRNKRIEEYVQRMKKEQPKMTLRQLKILHPLVTDDRCFNINWWPETTPKCFEDLGK